jgi:pyruvate/2-oxoglutarate dehydrogenase complex dihydrolipoamide acyltransferase (E2) component
MSGNFSGAILNIKSTLTNVSQSIGAAPHGGAATKAQLQALVEQLSAELQKAPAEQAGEAEAVAETAKAAVEQATKAQPNKTLVQISAEGLKQAAQNLAAVLPTVLPIATQIADTLRKMIGA